MLKQMHESPFSESMSRLTGATIVHNSASVTSAPMSECPPSLLKTLHRKTTVEERPEPLALEEEPAVAVVGDAR